VFSPSAPPEPTLSEPFAVPAPPLALFPFVKALSEVAIYIALTIPAPSLKFEESIKA